MGVLNPAKYEAWLRQELQQLGRPIARVPDKSQRFVDPVPATSSVGPNGAGERDAGLGPSKKAEVLQVPAPAPPSKRVRFSVHDQSDIQTQNALLKQRIQRLEASSSRLLRLSHQQALRRQRQIMNQNLLLNEMEDSFSMHDAGLL